MAAAVLGVPLNRVVVAANPYALAANLGSAHESAQVPRPCADVRYGCGFPDAANTGVPKTMVLRTVPGQVSSGPGWSYDPGGWVEVTGQGAVLSGLYIPCNLDISASDVTIKDVKVVAGGDFGISLRSTANVTIEDSTVAGQNATTGRVDTAIKDVYGGSTGTVIENNNIYGFRTGIELSAGLIQGNFVHSPGYQPGDHTNGIYDDGSASPLTIRHNTVLNPLGQTDAITLDASGGGQAVAKKTVTDNLIAGGDYAIYGGASLGNATSHVIITDNWFSQLYYRKGGQYGPAVYFDAAGSGDVWSGNVWSSLIQPGRIAETMSPVVARLRAVPAP